jgi:hypothetical protein
MAVAGNLHFCILAEFDNGDVIVGCECPQNFGFISDALQMHDFISLNARVLDSGGNQEWRILSWSASSTASLKTFSMCACSKSGPDVNVGWIGAVAVGADFPAVHLVSSAACNSILTISSAAAITASAVASRKIASFECFPEHETCDIQCLWTLPSSAFFPSVDVYLISQDSPLKMLGQTDSLIWQGRSALGVFIIRDAPLVLPMQVVLMGTDMMLRREVLARISISVPWIAPAITLE